MMGKVYLFYNPLAGGGKILEDLDILKFVLDTPCVFCDMTKPETYCEALFAMSPEDCLVLCGGDGTLNRFVNITEDSLRTDKLYYYPAGRQNNFALDFGRGYGCNPFPVADVLQSLPTVRIGERCGKFLTGILFDGCDRIHRISKKRRGYNTPRTVTVTVDGSRQTYEKVWLAAVLHGRNCGGMIPDTERHRTDGDLSCLLIHGCGRGRARAIRRKMAKGKPISSRYAACSRGREIHISFDRPVSTYTDGELQTAVNAITAEFTP